jgi:hypothetical protein
VTSEDNESKTIIGTVDEIEIGNLSELGCLVKGYHAPNFTYSFIYDNNGNMVELIKTYLSNREERMVITYADTIIAQAKELNSLGEERTYKFTYNANNKIEEITEVYLWSDSSLTYISNLGRYTYNELSMIENIVSPYFEFRFQYANGNIIEMVRTSRSSTYQETNSYSYSLVDDKKSFLGLLVKAVKNQPAFVHSILEFVVRGENNAGKIDYLLEVNGEQLAQGTTDLTYEYNLSQYPIKISSHRTYIFNNQEQVYDEDYEIVYYNCN